MANHASTDEIVKAAWNTSKDHWKEFILLPVIASAAFFMLVGVLGWALGPSSGSGSIFFLLSIAIGVFYVSYFGAQAKWCEELHKGAKSIDVQDGLKYGLSRFWGVIGTGLLTAVKTFLWLLLLVIPGYYKGLMYSKSIYVSILDKVSGGDANRISEAMIKKAGPIRAFSNLMGVSFLGIFGMYLLVFVGFLIGAIFGMVHEVVGAVVIGLLGGGAYAFAMTVMMVYFHYEYLYFRDEAKTEVAALKKALS
jgi:hypothetical protein